MSCLTHVHRAAQRPEELCSEGRFKGVCYLKPGHKE